VYVPTFRANTQRSRGDSVAARPIAQKCEQIVLDIKNIEVFIVGGVLTIFGLLEALSGLYGESSKRTRGDWYLEVSSTFALMLFIKPAAFLEAAILIKAIFPTYFMKYEHLSLLIAFPIVSLGEDLLQYWFHRACHHFPFMWRLHHAHHAAKDLGVLVTYRETSLIFVLMPNIYFMGIMTALGMWKAVILHVMVKQTIAIGAHSPVKWDRFLYQHELLASVAWIVERTISTPSTHFAHHGISAKDGVSHPNGNFANCYFVWDVLFGTALIHRKYTSEFGVEKDSGEPWAIQLLYPFIRSKHPHGEIYA
jgi:sterol desaturase/sphingolipid hydroxylase (fatty acid hydroxylase superfamily)